MHPFTQLVCEVNMDTINEADPVTAPSRHTSRSPAPNNYNYYGAMNINQVHGSLDQDQNLGLGVRAFDLA